MNVELVENGKSLNAGSIGVDFLPGSHVIYEGCDLDKNFTASICEIVFFKDPNNQNTFPHILQECGRKSLNDNLEKLANKTFVTNTAPKFIFFVNFRMLPLKFALLFSSSIDGLSTNRFF